MGLQSKIGTSERFRSVAIEVRIKSDGAGMSASQIDDALKRIAKAARGRSRLRWVGAWCDDISAVSRGDLYLT